MVRYPLYFLFYLCLVKLKGMYTLWESFQLNFSVITHDLEIHFVYIYIYLLYICIALFFWSLLITQLLEGILLCSLSPASFFQIVTARSQDCFLYLFLYFSLSPHFPFHQWLSVSLLKWSVHLIRTPVVLSPSCLLSLSFFWYSSSFSWPLSTRVSQGSDFRYLLYFLLTAVLMLSDFII